MKNKNNLMLAGVVILVIILLAWPAISRRNTDKNKTGDAVDITEESMRVEESTGTTTGLAEDGLAQSGVSMAGINGMTPPAPGMMSVKVFLHDAKKDPSYLKCDTVYPSMRWIDPTVTPARAALNQLLFGITPTESKTGLTTAINEGTALNSLVIENGVAKADFNSTLTQMVAGSCRVQAIRAQIIETLKQFPSVTSVVISVNGNSETILQP